MDYAKTRYQSNYILLQTCFMTSVCMHRLYQSAACDRVNQSTVLCAVKHSWRKYTCECFKITWLNVYSNLCSLFKVVLHLRRDQVSINVPNIQIIRSLHSDTILYKSKKTMMTLHAYTSSHTKNSAFLKFIENIMEAPPPASYAPIHIRMHVFFL